MVYVQTLRMMSVLMKRFKGNPILKPIPEHSWENRAVFNAGVLYVNRRVHILYRAIGDDGVSRLGYASSLDGYHIEERLASPIFEPVNYVEKDGCEDPRLTLLGKQIIMTYTALRNSVGYRIALSSISIDDFINKRWNWRDRWIPFTGVRNKDAVILPRKIGGRYVMFHRIHPSIWIAYSNDLQRWTVTEAIVRPRVGRWDYWKIGAGAPPIEIDEGWLFIYHGVNVEKVYRLGVLLLDKDDPRKVLYRSEKPILEPTKDYERFGRVPNVVFSCGAILRDNQVLVYYGGADSVICVATYDLSELIMRGRKT